MAIGGVSGEDIRARLMVRRPGCKGIRETGRDSEVLTIKHICIAISILLQNLEKRGKFRIIKFMKQNFSKPINFNINNIFEIKIIVDYNSKNIQKELCV